MSFLEDIGYTGATPPATLVARIGPTPPSHDMWWVEDNRRPADHITPRQVSWAEFHAEMRRRSDIYPTMKSEWRSRAGMWAGGSDPLYRVMRYGDFYPTDSTKPWRVTLNRAVTWGVSSWVGSQMGRFGVNTGVTFGWRAGTAWGLSYGIGTGLAIFGATYGIGLAYVWGTKVEDVWQYSFVGGAVVESLNVAYKGLNQARAFMRTNRYARALVGPGGTAAFDVLDYAEFLYKYYTGYTPPLQLVPWWLTEAGASYGALASSSGADE